MRTQILPLYNRAMLPSALFVSHGAPSIALDPGEVGRTWQKLPQFWSRPKALLVVSAHWEAAEPTLSLTPTPATIHDFSGFPQPLYEMHYPAPGASDLGQVVGKMLTDANIPWHQDNQRGLDHGAWVPLRFIYPAADIPVAELALPSHWSPTQLMALGEALSSLHEHGVLLLASGSLTHNLRDLRWPANGDDTSPPAHDYVLRFQKFIAAALSQGQWEQVGEALVSADGRRAHPTPEHFQPLLVAVGAGRGATVQRELPIVTYGALAMDAFVFLHKE